MKLVTNTFKTHVAKQFVESLTESDNSIYFVGAHRSSAFVNDSIPPDPATDLYATHYELYDELLFGKHVTAADVTHMIRNVPWTTGTVYEMYDSRLADPETKNFYVVSKEAASYHVFKCLNNNGGVPSTVQPKRSEIDPSDDFYQTSDGYEWKYMYSISPSQYLKFATLDYVPLFVNSAVKANAIDGSIDTLIIEDAGSSYYSFARGTFKDVAVGGNNLIYTLESSSMTLSSNDAFYENCSIYIDSGIGNGQIRTIIDYFVSGGQKSVLLDSPFEPTPDGSSSFIISPRVIISGDGVGARARCDIDEADGSVESVTIINRGQGYTYADIEVVGNTGTTSVATTSSALVRAVISPPGGHGSDPINELYASRVGIAVEFVGDEGATIPVANDFRKVSLIKDPLFKDADLILTESASASGLQIGEYVTQASTGASGKITGLSANTVSLTNIRGFFETSQPSAANSEVLDVNTAIVGMNSEITKYVYSLDRSFETFDQRQIFAVELTDDGLYNTGFIEDEYVVQSGLNQTSSTNLVRLTLSGLEDAFKFVDGETVSQVNAGGITVTGTVTARQMNVLTIASPTSYFTTNTDITGVTSGAVSIVTDYDNTFAATAIGIVHEVQMASSTIGTIALTGVNGTFLLSDTDTNTINSFKGQTSQSVASLTDIDESRNKLVDGSGEFMYVENFIPIDRDESQTERIKLVIEF